MIDIRFATETDFSLIRTFDPHSEYIDPSRIQHKIAQNEILLAMEDENIIGFLRFTYIWSTRPYIEFIFVNETHRNRGIGSKLLSFFMNELAQQNYTYIFSSSEEADVEAQQWHKNKGFNEMGKLTDLNLPHEKVAEVFFSKKISESTDLPTYPILP